MSILHPTHTSPRKSSLSYLRSCARDSALVLANTFGRSCLGAHLPAAQDAQHLRLLLREFKTINILLPHSRREREKRELFTKQRSTHTAVWKKKKKQEHLLLCRIWSVCECVRRKKLLFSWKRRRLIHHPYLLFFWRILEKTVTWSQETSIRREKTKIQNILLRKWFSFVGNRIMQKQINYEKTVTCS